MAFNCQLNTFFILYILLGSITEEKTSTECHAKQNYFLSYFSLATNTFVIYIRTEYKTVLAKMLTYSRIVSIVLPDNMQEHTDYLERKLYI